MSLERRWIEEQEERDRKKEKQIVSYSTSPSFFHLLFLCLLSSPLPSLPCLVRLPLFLPVIATLPGKPPSPSREVSVTQGAGRKG